jgi:hypothetical protein
MTGAAGAPAPRPSGTRALAGGRWQAIGQAIDRQAIGQAIDRQAIDRQAIDRQAIDRQAIGQAIDRQAIGQAIGIGNLGNLFLHCQDCQ